MVALSWDKVGERFYETGVDRGVFYPTSGSPEVWNGLVTVTENSEGGDSEPVYLDGRKVYDLMRNEDFVADIEAFSAPAGFKACDGLVSVAPGLFATQQPRKRFGFSYRTKVSTDVDENYGYKIHLVYNATAVPTTRTNKTVGGPADISPLKWSVKTVPPLARQYRPTAHLIIETKSVLPARLAQLESVLYGTNTINPSMPNQATVVSILLGV